MSFDFRSIGAVLCAVLWRYHPSNAHFPYTPWIGTQPLFPAPTWSSSTDMFVTSAVLSTLYLYRGTTQQPGCTTREPCCWVQAPNSSKKTWPSWTGWNGDSPVGRKAAVTSPGGQAGNQLCPPETCKLQWSKWTWASHQYRQHKQNTVCWGVSDWTGPRHLMDSLLKKLYGHAQFCNSTLYLIYQLNV